MRRLLLVPFVTMGLCAALASAGAGEQAKPAGKPVEKPAEKTAPAASSAPKAATPSSQQPATQTSTQSAAPAGQAPRDEAAIARGQTTYTKVGCYQCHGREGQGSPASGPRVGPNPLPLAAFIAYVRTPANEMPPYTAKVIGDADLTDIHAFLAVRAPAVKNVP